jgi:hypothetical protein
MISSEWNDTKRHFVIKKGNIFSHDSVDEMSSWWNDTTMKWQVGEWTKRLKFDPKAAYAFSKKTWKIFLLKKVLKTSICRGQREEGVGPGFSSAPKVVF